MADAAVRVLSVCHGIGEAGREMRLANTFDARVININLCFIGA